MRQKAEPKHLTPDDHPMCENSALFKQTEEWLQSQPGGCVICNGSETEVHRGGGLFFKGALIGLSLIGMEWVSGWKADPRIMEAEHAKLQAFYEAAGWPRYDGDLKTTADVMRYADSPFNANLKLCRAHHIGSPFGHTPDGRGHEAVGLHQVPLPAWLAQVTNDWQTFNPFAGTTGFLVLAPHPDMDGKTVVLWHGADRAFKYPPGKVLSALHTRSKAAWLRPWIKTARATLRDIPPDRGLTRR